MADKGSVTGGIVHYIRNNIQSGNWAVGSKIPSENELCRTLSVSRVSVRNALQQFIALGILESVHGKGTFLISNDLSLFTPAPGSEPQSVEALQTMKDILQFRCMIEPEICAYAAEHADAETLTRLEEFLATMRNSVGKSQQFIDADVNFHLELCRATKNPVTLCVMQDVFHSRTRVGHELSLATGYYGGIYYHSLLLDALKTRNVKRAHALMREHLERGLWDLSSDDADPTPPPPPEQPDPLSHT